MDSERIAVRLDVAVIAELGWPITEAEVIDRFMGRTEAFMAEEIAAHLGRPLPDDWEERYRHLYLQAFEAELAAVDGVAEALDRITAPICVASSGSHERIRYALGLTGLYERFAGRIFSASEVANGKPAPDLFLHAASEMGVRPYECAVVEDSWYGVEAARAAGMHVFGYSGGLTPRERLEGPNTLVFDDMRLLPALLGEV